MCIIEKLQPGVTRIADHFGFAQKHRFSLPVKSNQRRLRDIAAGKLIRRHPVIFRNRSQIFTERITAEERRDQPSRTESGDQQTQQISRNLSLEQLAGCERRRRTSGKDEIMQQQFDEERAGFSKRTSRQNSVLGPFSAERCKRIGKHKPAVFRRGEKDSAQQCLFTAMPAFLPEYAVQINFQIPAYGFHTVRKKVDAAANIQTTLRCFRIAEKLRSRQQGKTAAPQFPRDRSPVLLKRPRIELSSGGRILPSEYFLPFLSGQPGEIFPEAEQHIHLAHNKMTRQIHTGTQQQLMQFRSDQRGFLLCQSLIIRQQSIRRDHKDHSVQRTPVMEPVQQTDHPLPFRTAALQPAVEKDPSGDINHKRFRPQPAAERKRGTLRDLPFPPRGTEQFQIAVLQQGRFAALRFTENHKPRHIILFPVRLFQQPDPLQKQDPDQIQLRGQRLFRRLPLFSALHQRRKVFPDHQLFFQSGRLNHIASPADQPGDQRQHHHQKDQQNSQQSKDRQNPVILYPSHERTAWNRHGRRFYCIHYFFSPESTGSVCDAALT